MTIKIDTTNAVDGKVGGIKKKKKKEVAPVYCISFNVCYYYLSG